MNSIIVPAYAKINLTLDVLARRPDGYHNIRSIMQTVALHDTLEFGLTDAWPGVRLYVGGDEAAGVPNDAANIVWRAAAAMLAEATALEPRHRQPPGVEISLVKRIPAQAGLGGGSSDAAATLLALNSLLGLELSYERMGEIAAILGADVPFFLLGCCARVEGLGERVTPLPQLALPRWVVIVKPPVGVSTAKAYGALDAQVGRVPGNATVTWDNGGIGLLSNDFELVALTDTPEIATAYRELEFSAGSPPLLCGSGAALFCLVASQDAAETLAAHLTSKNIGRVWLTEIQDRVI